MRIGADWEDGIVAAVAETGLVTIAGDRSLSESGSRNAGGTTENGLSRCADGKMPVCGEKG